MRIWPAALSIGMCVFAGCDSKTQANDAGLSADAQADGGSVDGSALDSGPLFPTPGFGEIAGACDELDVELVDAFTTSFRSSITFDQVFDSEQDGDELSEGGFEILTHENAGGSSILSEVFAFELLARCESAALYKRETEIVYDAPGAKTDLAVDMDQVRIGVSVTRAVAFPFDSEYTLAKAQELVGKKLAGIQESTALVSEEDRWQKQLLVVLAYGDEHADRIHEAWQAASSELRGDSVLWLLVTHGEDLFIYE